MKNLFSTLLVVFALTFNALALGVPDLNFGFSGKINAGFGKGNDRIQFSAVGADGSVIGLGRGGTGESYSYVLAKWTPQGAPDSSFGNGGLAGLNLSSFNIPLLSSDPVGLVVTQDGYIYVAGGHGPDMSVGKYNPTGQLVQVFDGGETGSLLNGVAQALAVQPDGSVLVAGYQGNEFGHYAVYRYLPGGALDINFGKGGRSYVDMGAKGGPTSIAVQSDGKFIVTGSIIPDDSTTPEITQSLIARYNFNGSLDSSFNSTGMFINPVRNGRSEVFQKSFTLKDGRIMATGTSRDLTNFFAAKKYIFSRFTQNGFPDRFFGSRGTIISSLTGDDRAAAIYSFGYGNDGSIFVGDNGTRVNKFDSSGNADLSFGTQGVSTLPSDSRVYSLNVAPDGKLVAAGARDMGIPAPAPGKVDYDFLVHRLNSNGAADNGFDDDGRASRDVGDFSSSISAMAIQADGKIVVTGGLFGLGNAIYGTGLSRYNPDGTTDMSFGNQGKVYLSTSTQGNYATTTVLGVTVQTDGKIVVAGLLGFTGSNSAGVRVTRFNENGSLDNSFGSGGAFTYMQSGLNVFAVAQQPDGKIVLGGFVSGAFDFMLMRLAQNGTLDPELGGTGIVFTDFNGQDATAIAMAIQPNGKILLAGAAGSGYADFAMARYHINGTLDQTFGRKGKVITPMGFNTEEGIHSIALTPEGNIVVAGYKRSSDAVDSTVVARYTGKGQLDSSFANGGVYNTPASLITYIYGQSAQVASDGSILATIATQQNLQILKLTPAGVPDQSWAPNGFLNTGIRSGALYSPDCLFDANGKLVVSGLEGSGQGFIARFANTP